jgi:hypothetical protein
MQNKLKLIYIFIMFLYVSIAIINPNKIYIDRFLFNMKYFEWIPFQIFPSMYTTEILIIKKNQDTVSTVHHPMRIFFEEFKKEKSICDTTQIYVRYQNITKKQNIVFLKNRIRILPIINEK